MLLAETFSSLHLERNYLITLNMIQNFCLDLQLHVFSNSQLAVVVCEQNFTEFNFVTRITGNTRNIQSLIFFYSELLPGYFNNCKHDFKIMERKANEKSLKSAFIFS